MDACEEYARRWAKQEDVEADTLSESIKSIAYVLKRRIRRLSTPDTSPFSVILVLLENVPVSMRISS